MAFKLDEDKQKVIASNRIGSLLDVELKHEHVLFKLCAQTSSGVIFCWI